MARFGDCGCGCGALVAPSRTATRAGRHGHARRAPRLSLDVRVNGRRAFSRDAAGPAPLYVSRALDPECGRAVAAWARSLGLADVTPPPQMHVTVAYSRTPVDWFAMTAGVLEVYVLAGGPRRLEQFKGGVVLRFVSPQLKARWAELRAAGCSWDWPDYAPHVTVAGGPGRARLDSTPAYPGELRFGPEIFAPVKD